MGPDAFASAVARGREQTREAAVTFALADEASSARAPGPDVLLALTPREHEVARLLARGLTNRAIAHELIISQQTAETHVKRILAKLGLQSRTHVAARAAELGLADRAPG